MRRYRVVVACLTLTLSAPTLALAAKPAAVPRTQPQQAESNRELARQAAASDIASGNHAGAATTLEEAAKEFGDPLLFLEAAEVCLAGAGEQSDPQLAERAKNDAFIALDILQFQREGDTKWVVVDAAVIPMNVDRANTAIRRADEIVADIAGQQAAEEHKAQRGQSSAIGMVGAGIGFAGLGVVGLALMATGLGLGAARQKDVEALNLDDPADQAKFSDLDDKGKTANVIAYVGGAVAAVGLATGIALIVLGKKRQGGGGGAADKNARVRVLPIPNGAVIVGRF